MDKKIVIATNNKGKAKEFKSLFNDYGYKVKTLQYLPKIGEIPETGNTSAENALQKASSISRELNTIVLADDSGLEVEALNNEPGIYSARYAGEHGNDQKNNEKLLKELKNVPKEERKANFHCTRSEERRVGREVLNKSTRRLYKKKERHMELGG